MPNTLTPRRPSATNEFRGGILHLSCRPELGEQLSWHKSCINVFAACRMRWRASILPGLHMLEAPQRPQMMVRWTIRRAASSI
jgi:hypothetical protein